MKEIEFHKFVNRPSLAEMHSLQLSGRYNASMDQLGKALRSVNNVTLVRENENEAVLTVKNIAHGSDVNNVYFWTERNVICAECDCRKTQGDQRLLCEHKVAAYYLLMDMHKPRRVPTWERLVREAVAPLKAEPAAKPNQVLVFAFVPDHPHYKLVPYGLPSNQFREIETGDPLAVTEHILSSNLSTQAKVLTKFNSDRFVNVTDESELAIRTLLVVDQANRYTYPKLKQPLGKLLPQLTDYAIFLGDMRRPLTTPLTLVFEPASAEIVVETNDEGIHIQPVLNLGESVYTLGQQAAVFIHPRRSGLGSRRGQGFSS